jgi:peptidoglycan hydrolase-like protein with peptidoglycan-binding domain
MVAVKNVQSKPVKSTNAASRSSGPSLAQARAGEGLIRKGQSGSNVRQLQQQLKDQGYNIEVDGKFGPATDRIVRQFQSDKGLKVDGLVGPQTSGNLHGVTTGNHDYLCKHDNRNAAPQSVYSQRRAPTQSQSQSKPEGTVRASDLAQADRAAEARRNGPARAGAVTLAPEGLSERERFDHYASIVRANGGQVNPNGQPTVLGIRGLSRDGQTHDTGSTRRYDDTMVVLTPDGRVQEFAGATHPGQNSSSASPDVAGRNGGGRDGQGDVGMINPGNYQVDTNGYRNGSPSYRVKTEDGSSGRLNGVRDTNHDGVFSDAERGNSADRGDQLTGVLFHPGGSSRPSSIGCQTMSPSEYRRFVDTIGGSRANFNYSLVDAYSRD